MKTLATLSSGLVAASSNEQDHSHWLASEENHRQSRTRLLVWESHDAGAAGLMQIRQEMQIRKESQVLQ